MTHGIIDIDSNWRIAIEDELNFTLQRKSLSKTGKESWKAFGYYGDLETLCLDLRDNMVREGKPDSVNELIKAVFTSTDTIKKSLGESPLLEGV